MQRIKRKSKKIKKIFVFLIGLFVILAIYLISFKYSNISFFPFNYIKDGIIQFEKKFFLLGNCQCGNKYSYDSNEAEIKNLNYEISILKDSLNLKNIISNYDLINATVTYRNPNFWFNELVIDKGRKDGVDLGMAVITGSGLIGVIASTTKTTATIKLLSSFDKQNISVGVESKNKYIHGLISNFDFKNNIIIIDGISNYDDIYINSKVVTTGINEKFPSGLLVGYVKEIKNSKYDLGKKVYVSSNQNLSDIRYVTVIKR